MEEEIIGSLSTKLNRDNEVRSIPCRVALRGERGEERGGGGEKGGGGGGVRMRCRGCASRGKYFLIGGWASLKIGGE